MFALKLANFSPWDGVSTPIISPFSPDVDLWLLEPGQEISALLTIEETAKMEAISSPTARRDFIRARSFPKLIGAIYLGLSPEAVLLGRGVMGKPYWETAAHWHFNLTHTCGSILLAVSGQEVGIDAESMHRKVSAGALGRRYFHESEFHYLESLPEADLTRAFLRFWTCKEAAVKAAGDGIAGNIMSSRIRVELDSFECKYRGRPLWLEQQAVAEHLCVTIAAFSPFQVKSWLRW